MGRPACDVPTLVRIAGSRWRIESAFEMAKQEAGQNEYEVRNARGWDRHMILALWALALLSVVRAAWPLSDRPTVWPGADRARNPTAVAAPAAAVGRGP